MDVHPSCPRTGQRPPLEVADVLRSVLDSYREDHLLSIPQERAVRAILACRTATLGGHEDQCPSCGYTSNSYNSCRNRHCPKCQGLAQARWVQQRMDHVLPVPHFHVVFTLPSELHPLLRANRRFLFDLLFTTAADTLLSLGRDPKYMGGLLGVTAVLHTWTRDLRFHPHLHCIVTGGGLDPEGNWVPARGKDRFLFPVQVLSELFHDKFLSALVAAYKQDRLTLAGPAAHLKDPQAFLRLKAHLYDKEWVVYAKRPFAGPEQVFRYLGRYTHRVGLSNWRLREMDDETVTFATKDGQTVTLPGEAFVGRFLQHVLPPHFVKIRHYGLLASGRLHTHYARAQALLTPSLPPQPATVQHHQPLTWEEWVEHSTGVALAACPRCGAEGLIRRALPARPPPPRVAA